MCGVHLGRMECPICNSRGKWGKTSKWQWVNSKLGSFRIGFQIYKLNFEFISWISKWSFSFTQLSSNDNTSSFQLWFAHRLKCWTLDFPSFVMIYSMSKMDSWKFSKFILKVKLYVASRFWVLNFYVAKSCFMPHLPCFLAFFLTP